MTVEIKNIPGQLPPFWDRNVIFFANMHSIFYDNIGGLNRLKQQIRGIDTYGGRLIPIIISFSKEIIICWYWRGPLIKHYYAISKKTLV